MKKRILLAFDMASKPPADHRYEDFFSNPDWDAEFYLQKALKNLGYEVFLRGIYDDLAQFIRELETIKPDVVINLLATFKNSRNHEATLAGILDMMAIPYTGSKPLALSICQDKVLSKKILRHHRIRVADWVVSTPQAPVKKLKDFRFPAFVKSAVTEGSEGISKDSLVENEKDCLDRVHYLHQKFGGEVLIEEFIPGREIYASVMGDKRLTVYPLRELKIFNQEEGEPIFATYKAKWDEKYRKKWRIQNRFAKGLSPETETKIVNLVKRGFRALKLQGYARFDLRLTENDEVVVLEANPNPAIATYDDFPQSLIKAGISYEKMLKRIIELAS